MVTPVALSGNGQTHRAARFYIERMAGTRPSQPVKRYVCKQIDSPVGPLQLVATDDGLAAILWENDSPRRVRLRVDGEDPGHPVLLEAERQLQEYFAGTRRAFELTLDVTGTDFQQKVWRALLTIPYGETRSYGEIAALIGHPGAVRAVGAANGRNPVSIVAPCHRVIGSTGRLTGFAGGLDAKARLLTLEGVTFDPFMPGW
jgi:methylated-DNA-[protein]-cysteine S-methyltransferase